MGKIIFICLLLLAACEKKEATPSNPPMDVTVYEVVEQNVPANFEFVGVAQSSHLVEIWSRVEGYLWKIAYTEGGFVKEGDLLFQIDPRQFEAAVDEVKGELSREKAILWTAQRSVERYTPLYEQKAASRKDLDDATGQMLASQASVETAQAKLTEAELNLSYTAITSPISGLTVRSKYREGTLINPGVNGLLTTVSVIDPIWVIFGVSDSYLLSANQEIAEKKLITPENYDVTLILADGSELPNVGKVNFASPVLDQTTGTMTVRAEFKNPGNLVKPGQFIRARLTGAIRPNAMIVPQQSVQQGANGMYVFVVNEKSQAELRLVQVGDWYENYWIIKSGLESGDEVIVGGVNKVGNGSPVNVLTNKKKKTKK